MTNSEILCAVIRGEMTSMEAALEMEQNDVNEWLSQKPRFVPVWVWQGLYEFFR